MKINKSLVEAKWVEYEEDDTVSFKVRQFPLSQGMWMSGNNEEFMEFNWKRFEYAVIDWKGIVDEDGIEIECNDENKKFIYDFVPEISLWVTASMADRADNIIEKKI